MRHISLVLVILFSLSVLFASQPALAATCWDCDGAKAKDCGWCGADGIKEGRLCGHCRGKGTIPCFKCGGTGTVDKN